MKEEFLHYLWKYRLFNPPLISTQGEVIEVIKTGMHNPDAGPDFVDARLRIGNTVWAGNIEIHIQSSAWYDHHHHKDTAYNNVILHVVLNDDNPAVRSDGQIIPCMECSKQIPYPMYEKYRDLMSSKLWIPCARIIKYCPGITINSWIENQLVERLASKAASIEMMWHNTGNDWEETFYRLLARSFGLKINTLPFEMLAASLPYKILAKHQDQPLQLDAMLFGQAGFLNDDFHDDYPATLKKEYAFLSNKYSLQAMDASIWKFLRLRPHAFPTIRLAMFSALMQKSSSLFSLVIETKDIGDLRNFFRAQAADYWVDHYRFDKVANDSGVKAPGDQVIDVLLINAVVPILFLYGQQLQIEEYKTRAFGLLEQLPPENNAIINKWKSLGLEVENAFASQALLNLKQAYCDRKKCLECRIGNELLK